MEEFSSFIVVVIGAVIAIISSAQKKKQQSVGTARPGMSAARPPQAPAAAKPASMADMLPPRDSSPMQPTVHTHFEPDCEMHDAPTSGSLGVVSTEGKDPCHADQLNRDLEPLAGETTRPGLTFDWSGEAMVKAFAMQEVLARPSDRKRR